MHEPLSMEGPRHPLRFANVVSTAALVLSLGLSGAVAKSLVTGKDVVDDSLTGRDFRNRTIAARDVVRAPFPTIYRWSGPGIHGDCFESCEGVHGSGPPPAHCFPGDVALGGGLGGIGGGPGSGLTSILPLADKPGGPPVGWAGGAVIVIDGSPAAIPGGNANVTCVTEAPDPPALRTRDG